jgi:hypothetical protein
MHWFEEVGSRTFFHTLIKSFVDIGFGNAWQLVINRIHETLKTSLWNFRQVSLGATRIEKQSVKKSNEWSDDKVGPKTTKCV